MRDLWVEEGRHWPTPCSFRFATARCQSLLTSPTRSRGSLTVIPAFAGMTVRNDCPSTAASSRYQNLKPNFTPITRGRSGTSDLMNCADEVNTLAWLLLRLVPYRERSQASFAMPTEASYVV